MKKLIFNLFPKCIKEHKYADKIAHAVIGLLIFTFSLIFLSAIAACIVVTIIALINELIDKHNKYNHFNWWDVFWTILLPILTTLILTLIS